MSTFVGPAIARDLRARLRSSHVVAAPAQLRAFAHDASFLTQLAPGAT